MTQQSTERDRSTLALDGDAIGREAARLGPPRAQRPPGRAHGVYRRHVSRLVLVFDAIIIANVPTHRLLLGKQGSLCNYCEKGKTPIQKVEQHT